MHWKIRTVKWTEGSQGLIQSSRLNEAPCEKREGGKEAVTQKCWHSQKHKALFSLQISGIMVPVDANLIAAKFDGT